MLIGYHTRNSIRTERKCEQRTCFMHILLLHQLIEKVLLIVLLHQIKLICKKIASSHYRMDISCISKFKNDHLLQDYIRWPYQTLPFHEYISNDSLFRLLFVMILCEYTRLLSMNYQSNNSQSNNDIHCSWYF